MRTGILNILGAVAGLFQNSVDIKNLILNILLNSFRIIKENSLSISSLVNGFTDAYIDETGINTGSSTNQVYDSGNNLYQPFSSEVGIDSDVKLLLHLDNNITDSELTPKTGTNSGVTFSTSGAKFNYSGIFNGSSYIYFDDSDDWNFGTGDFTIDLWVKPSTISTQTWVAQGNSLSAIWLFGMVDNGTARFTYYNDGYIVDFSTTADMVQNVWQHMAIVRNGNIWSIYRNGIAIGTTNVSATMPNFSAQLWVGRQTDISPYEFFTDGSLDEIRISKGVARWTSNFTPPTSAYSESAVIDNMTLLSEAQVLSSVPSLVYFNIYEEDVDAITLNTDLILSLSRDSGTTFTDTVLLNYGEYQPNKKMLSTLIDLSAQPSGSDFIYKIRTLNNKLCKIHGVSILHK